MSSEAPGSTVTLDHVLSNAKDGIFAVDKDHRCVMFNEACERLTGRRATDMVGSDCQCERLFGCRDEHNRSLAGALCPATSIFQGNTDSARQRIRIRRPNGDPGWVETIYTSVRDKSGDVNLVLGIIRDATEAKHKEDRLLSEVSELRDRMRELSDHQRTRYGFDSVLSKSPAMEPVLERIKSALNNHAPVLICGEAGAGKEAVARAIHNEGTQPEGPFVPFNCAAHPRDLLEQELFGYDRNAVPNSTESRPGAIRNADGGTLFLERISEMRPETQVRLLRAISDNRVRPVGGTVDYPVQLRVLASMTEDPQDAIEQHKLREDLYYKLNVIRVDIPPLRKRAEDIPIIVQSMIDKLNLTHARKIETVSSGAWETLRAYSWPGNIRQLSNAIESAFALGQGPELRKEDLPPEVLGLTGPRLSEQDAASLRLDPFLHRVEREAIHRALKAANWQRNKAAALMGISRSRLYRRMEALGIDPEENR